MGGGMRDKKIKEIEAIIKKRFRDYQFSVDELAGQVGISGSRLREIVHAEYGVSPHDLIEVLRLKESIKILASENSPTLFEVCKKVGYLNYKTFKKAFKNRVRMCPSECKRLFKESTNRDQLLRELLVRLNGDNRGDR